MKITWKVIELKEFSLLKFLRGFNLGVISERLASRYCISVVKYRKRTLCGKRHVLLGYAFVVSCCLMTVGMLQFLQVFEPINFPKPLW